MTTIAKGANLPIAVAGVRATLYWTAGPGIPDVDASALLLGPDDRVGSDEDFVFYNQPRHPGGAVRHVGKAGATDAVDVDLASLPPRVERVVLAASADGGTFGAVPGLRLVVADLATGVAIAEFHLSATEETAMVTGEFYRRAGQWKFRAVGQGYASGLAGLATDFGISVAEEAREPASTAASTAAVAPPPGFVPPPPPPGFVPPPFPGTAPPAPSTYVPPPPPPGFVPPPPPPGYVPAPFPGAPAADTLDAGRVSLVKGARVSLVKAGAPPLAQVTMGLGWDPARGRRSIDLDASAVAFDAGGRRVGIVWFSHLSDFGGALRHGGDNLTGKGEGDDEQIHVDLSSLPPTVASLVFTITSYRRQRFTEVANAFCRLVDARTGGELVRYNLSEAQPATGVVMAMLRRTAGGPWEMRAIGEFHDGRTVRDLLDPAARYATMP